MNHADGLVASVLERPADPAPWLILADWLEEQGGPDDLARAELLRLRSAYASDQAWEDQADERAAAILEAQPSLVGPLQPLLSLQFRVLASPVALAAFLLADHVSVAPGPLAAGTAWVGELRQGTYAFPTTLWLRKRDGNRFEGDMKEDFSAMYGHKVGGRFYFRGAVVGSHLAFVTYRTKGAAAGPGLYQFRLSRRKRWTGTWGVGAGAWHGTMWLKPKPPENAEM